jgi:hypothetical protein
VTRKIALWFAPAWLTLYGAPASTAEPAAALPPVALQDLNLHRSWFKPVPARDADPICGALASDARRYFLTAGDWPAYAAAGMAEGTGLVRIASRSGTATRVAELRTLSDDPQQLILERPNQARLFLYFTAPPDCESGCDQKSLTVADQLITAQAATAQTPGAEAWTLYRAPSNAWYAAGIVEQHLQLYALTTPQQWRLSCDVALTPYRLRQSLDPTARAALAAVDALHASARSLDAAVPCSRKPSVQMLEPALFRPWQWLDASRQEQRHQTQQKLTEWAEQGQQQRATLERFNTQLTSSIAAMQRFYAQKFGWTTQVATRVAFDSLSNAVLDGLGAPAPVGSGCVPEHTGF